MSHITRLLSLSPSSMTRTNEAEEYQEDGFVCPTCKGKGFFNQSGWAQKFKKNIEDPDYVACERCKGTGELIADVVIKWNAKDAPSKCPEDE